MTHLHLCEILKTQFYFYRPLVASSHPHPDQYTARYTLSPCSLLFSFSSSSSSLVPPSHPCDCGLYLLVFLLPAPTFLSFYLTLPLSLPFCSPPPSFPLCTTPLILYYDLSVLSWPSQDLIFISSVLCSMV